MAGKDIRPSGTRTGGRRDRGSIFTTLLAGAALVGAISFMTYQTMSGPVSTMVRATQKATADTQMTTVSKLIISAASGSDCDADNFVEPAPWVTATTPAGSYPVNGGLLPTGLGLPQKDPWGTSYGYCVWDTGAQIGAAGCGGAAQNRLGGVANPTAGAAGLQTVIAVISAGPDKHFDTTCYSYASPVTDATKQSATDLVQTAAGKDDLVTRYTYTQASQATSSVWKLGTPSTTASTKTQAQQLEVGDVGDYNAANGVVAARSFLSSGLISAGGGLQLADQTKVANGDCTVALAGALRYNTAGPAVEYCGVGPAWTPLGTGGGSPTGATDVNGIDFLRDGIAEYSAKNITGLGQGALCQYGGPASGAKPADAGGCDSHPGVYYSPAVVQTTPKWHIGDNGAKTHTVTFSSAPAAGNTVIVMIAGQPGASNGTGNFNVLAANVTDNQGGTSGSYALAYQNSAGNSWGDVKIFYRSNITAPSGAFTVTATTVNNAAITMVAMEVSGILTAGALDKTGGGAGGLGTTTTTLSTAATVQSVELAVGALREGDGDAAMSNVNFGSASGWTQAAVENDSWHYTGASFVYTVLSSAGTVTHTWSHIANSGYSNIGGIATFKAAANPNPGTGVRNTAVGINALYSNTSGNDNTAFGYQALASDTSGSYNTGFGYQALAANTGGSYHTAAGSGALAAASSGIIGGVTLKGTASGGSVNPTTMQFTVPGGVVVGDTLVLAVNADDDGGTTITWPAGFTQRQMTSVNAVDGFTYGVATKVVTASEVAGSLLTVTFGNSPCCGGTGILAAYSGVDTVTPVNISSKNDNAGPVSSPYTITGSATTTLPNTQLLFIAPLDICCAGNGSHSFTPPAGFTTRIGVEDPYAPMYMADKMSAAAGPTGALSATLAAPGDSGAFSGVVLALAPVTGVMLTTVYPSADTAAGYQALAADTTGNYNTAAGYQALKSNTTGNGNTAAGPMSLMANVAGSYNTAAGYSALQSGTATDGNTAAGTYTFAGLLTGSGNTGLGHNHMIYATGGSRNTLAGWQDLYHAENSNDNTVLDGEQLWGVSGTSTFSGNTSIRGMTNNTANNNTAIGEGALGVSTTNQYLTAIGEGALSTMKSNGTTNLGGDGNTAIGYQAMGAQAVGGGWNTAFGYQAMMSLRKTDGAWDNTAVGYMAATAVSPFSSGNMVSIGYQALKTAGNGVNACCNVAIGYEADKLFNGSNWGTAVGYQALAATTSGASQGVMVGYQAGVAATTPDVFITVVGSKALSSMKTGGYNLALGYQAAKGVTTSGSGNMAVGYNALAGTTATAAFSDVAAFGANAFARGNASGYAAGLAFGSGAGSAATYTGDWFSLGFGYNAWKSKTSGMSFAVGWQSQQAATTGDQDSSIGADSLSSLTTGVGNYAYGYQALKSVVTGSQNTAIGAKALSASTGTDNTAIGHGALGVNTSGNSNSAMGWNALGADTSGKQNTAVGASALSVNTTGDNNVAIGYSAGPTVNNLSNTICIGNGATVSSSNTVRIGNSSVSYISAQVALTLISDRRLKKDIADSDLALDFIMKLRPVSYRLISGDGRLDYGFIAQDLEAALDGRATNMVVRENDADKTYRIRPGDLLAPVVKAIQQQQAASDARQRDIDAMKADLLEMQGMLADVKEARP